MGVSKNSQVVRNTPIGKEKMLSMKKIDYKDLKSLEKTFIDMGTDKAKLGLSLIEEANFLGQLLVDLKKKVNEEGVVTEMCQGSYSINRENPALRSYNISIKNYQSLVKQITELLPKNDISIEDEFDNFNE